MSTNMDSEFGNIETLTKHDLKWLKMYKLAYEYYKEHGNLMIPARYVISINGNSFALGSWIEYQRRCYSNEKLDDNKIELLESIDMIWNVLSHSWDKMYKLAYEYYKEHGDLLIPQSYKIIDNGIVMNLGVWINTQRCNYRNKSLSPKRVALLESINMNWNPEKDWNKMYKLACEYYHKNGNLLIPIGYFIDLEGDKINLGTWISRQRVQYKEKQLIQERIELLESIGMAWEVDLEELYTDRWNKMYEYAEEYYKEHGNLLIPHSFLLITDEEIITLGHWIAYQRAQYKKKQLVQERIELLESIGMVWKVDLEKKNNNKWLKKFEYAKKYYEEHGDLLMPRSFILITDHERVNLGTWIQAQRDSYRNQKLSQERIELLESIGMVWKVKNGLNKKYIDDSEAKEKKDQPKQLVKKPKNNYKVQQ